MTPPELALIVALFGSLLAIKQGGASWPATLVCLFAMPLVLALLWLIHVALMA